jgi:hypothetical protein
MTWAARKLDALGPTRNKQSNLASANLAARSLLKIAKARSPSAMVLEITGAALKVWQENPRLSICSGAIWREPNDGWAVAYSATPKNQGWPN